MSPIGIFLFYWTNLAYIDFDRVAYPLVELGWKIGADINPLIYTYTDWQRRSFTLFYKNVEQEGIELCH